MKGPTEKEIVNEIRELLRFLNIFHWKVFTGPTNLPGIADILGCYKGRFLAIEVKRKGQNPTELQQAFIDQIQRAGGLAFVARSSDDVIDGLGLKNKFK
jgi:Holliday junction resolvase